MGKLGKKELHLQMPLSALPQGLGAYDLELRQDGGRAGCAQYRHDRAVSLPLHRGCLVDIQGGVSPQKLKAV